MVETVLPGLLFVTIFTIDKDLHWSAIAALAVAAPPTGMRSGGAAPTPRKGKSGG